MDLKIQQSTVFFKTNVHVVESELKVLNIFISFYEVLVFPIALPGINLSQTISLIYVSVIL